MMHLPKICVALMVVAMVLACTSPALAGDLKGNINSIDADDFMFVLEVANGQFLSVYMDEDFDIYLNDRTVPLSELRAGDEVTVRAREEGNLWYATEVWCERK